jgi:hypothetical protein
MAHKIEWFRNDGQTPTPIKLPNGNTMSVPPRGLVPTTAALARGLKRAAPPKDADEQLAALKLEQPVKVPVDFPKTGSLGEHVLEGAEAVAAKTRKVKKLNLPAHKPGESEAEKPVPE